MLQGFSRQVPGIPSKISQPMSLPEDTPPAERDFVELATRSLAGRPELCEAAQLELLGRVSQTDPATRHGLIEKAVSRLAKVRPNPEGGLMGRIAAAWLLLAAIVALQIFAFTRESKAVPAESRKFPLLVTEHREFSDPADLEDYLLREGKMPPDFHEIWTRIDPDNGAWPWMEAQWLCGGDGAKDGHTKRLVGGGPGWRNEDFTKAWQLVEQAVQSPRFEWYFPERRAARQASAGAGRSVLAIASQARANRRGDALTPWWGATDELFSERAMRVRRTADKEGLKRTIRLRDQLLARIGAELGTYEDHRLLDPSGAENELFRAAQELWLDTDPAKILPQTSPVSVAIAVPSITPGFLCGPQTGDTLWDWRGFLGNRGWLTPEAERGFLAGSLLIANQPAADYQPGRLAEYAVTERVVALGAAVLLLAMMLVLWLKGRMRERWIRGLAEGLAPVFDKRDWLWTSGLGIAAPLAWYWGITRLTPLGYRSAGGSGLLILVQGSAAFLLALVMIGLASRWRVSRQTALIGLSARRLWPWCCLALLLAAAIPLAGVFKLSLDHAFKEELPGVLIAARALLLLLVCMGIAKLLPIGRKSLYSAMLDRTALPVLSAAVLLLAGTHALLLAQERSLLARDPLTGWDTAHGSTRYQARMMERVNARCRELLEQGALDQRELGLPRD